MCLDYSNMSFYELEREVYRPDSDNELARALLRGMEDRIADQFEDDNTERTNALRDAIEVTSYLHEPNIWQKDDHGYHVKGFDADTNYNNHEIRITERGSGCWEVNICMDGEGEFVHQTKIVGVRFKEAQARTIKIVLSMMMKGHYLELT